MKYITHLDYQSMTLSALSFWSQQVISQRNSTDFWKWHMTHWITYCLNFVHHPTLDIYFKCGAIRSKQRMIPSAISYFVTDSKITQLNQYQLTTAYSFSIGICTNWKLWQTKARILCFLYTVKCQYLTNTK